MKIKFLALFALTMPLLIFFLWIFISGIFLNNKNLPNPVSPDFNKDYSLLYKVVPGKSTMNDVIKINGRPQTQQTNGDKTYLYYQTPSADYKNVVLLQGDVVVYTLENIFGNYRGNIETFKKKYGDSNITVYEKGNDFPWYIYLNRGLGVQSSSGLITALLYFQPQGEQSFFSNIGNDLNLNKNNLPAEEVPQKTEFPNNNQIQNYPIPGP